MAGLLALVVFLSASQANQLAAERQERMVAAALKLSAVQIAHDQEAVTIWDDAVRQMLRPAPDPVWLDANLGIWLHTYNKHDEAFVIDGHDRPVYAMRNGRRVAPTDYGRYLEPIAARMIPDLRYRLRHPSPGDIGPSARSAGASDLAIVAGHPSIVSIKPIVSDHGALGQVPGQEFLHVSVRHLDGSFVKALEQQYQFKDARFALSPHADAGQRAIQIASRSGVVLGYFVWTPFTPGGIMVRRIVPASAGALLLILATVGWLLRRIRRGALQLEASRAQAEHLAFHDALTGLANRALFEDRLTRALADARGSTRSVALLYFDLDRFKNVNDSLGHPAGDALICAMGRRLSDATRATDLVARIGGDEFAIIQSDVASPAEAEILCMRIVEAVNEPFDLLGTRLNIGVSIGVAIAPFDATDRTELARKADIALYEAKAAGRGRYVFFAEAMDATIRHRQEVERDLRAALLAGDQFDLVYQPVYAAQTLRIAGAEALVRWRHPHNGVMPPSTFVPIAEATGLIEPLGEWVLEQACRTAVGWPIHSVSVNVSAVQLRNERFADRVLAILARTGLAPERLELEITETSFLDDAAHCRANIAALRDKGIEIALDDFGTGYSSFSHLREFEVDRIKIDQSFVHGIDMDNGGSPIIQAIVDLARASGMQVTAEGVETAEQRRFLARAGCNLLQGYLLSMPVTAAELGDLLGAHQEREPAFLSVAR
ncbi:MAG: diguanylate cyclase [Sphingomonas bacterium]|uniref:putative bifunctional diguanylate cyclase/phosphodiesterase n=1 Tax=Sphingomonas bacterium TaxID=1895847 RepID=UPI00260A638B|nr:EAL domain-containing protein [Sphingomonas bacterium]MDB5705251.1 diguanylate cyclase [Sphingomonas bacterium]